MKLKKQQNSQTAVEGRRKMSVDLHCNVKTNTSSNAEVAKTAVEMRADELQREVPQMNRATALRQAARQIEQGADVTPSKDENVMYEVKIALQSLRSTTQADCADCVSNDTAKNYQATMAAIAECRVVLDEIEYSMCQELKQSAAWHRECLTDVEACLEDYAARACVAEFEGGEAA